MRCPHCGADASRVQLTRTPDTFPRTRDGEGIMGFYRRYSEAVEAFLGEDPSLTVRQHRCTPCGKTFKTIEVDAEALVAALAQRLQPGPGKEDAAEPAEVSAQRCVACGADAVVIRLGADALDRLLESG